MNVAATKPPTSPTIPPPKAISSDPRSPPARTISRSSRSTLLIVLCCSPGGRNSVTGVSIFSSWNDRRNFFDHSAQISGDVTTNTRLGNRPTARSIRGASSWSNPLPANTSYFAEGVSTRIVCTVFSMIEDPRPTRPCGASLLSCTAGLQTGCSAGVLARTSSPVTTESLRWVPPVPRIWGPGIPQALIRALSS